MPGSTCTENYDGNGNLLSKVDARKVTTNYSYDQLNRMLTKSYVTAGSYTTGGAVTATPNVAFSYDSAGTGGYNVGRLTGVSTGAITSDVATIPTITETTSYDALGRPSISQQLFGASTPVPPQPAVTPSQASFAYTYNLAGALATETYPSGRVVTMGYDALNRQSSVGSRVTQYVGTASYAANDAPSQILFGSACRRIARRCARVTRRRTACP